MIYHMSFRQFTFENLIWKFNFSDSFRRMTDPDIISVPSIHRRAKNLKVIQNRRTQVTKESFHTWSEFLVKSSKFLYSSYFELWITRRVTQKPSRSDPSIISNEKLERYRLKALDPDWLASAYREIVGGRDHGSWRRFVHRSCSNADFLHIQRSQHHVKNRRLIRKSDSSTNRSDELSSADRIAQDTKGRGAATRRSWMKVPRGIPCAACCTRFSTGIFWQPFESFVHWHLYRAHDQRTPWLNWKSEKLPHSVHVLWVTVPFVLIVDTICHVSSPIYIS